MVSPPSSPFRSRTKRKTFDREFSQQIFSSLHDDLRDDSYGKPSRNLDESTALSYLKELIAAGDHRLDPMLATLTDAACRLTGATGAALAMWKDGAMVCRARSGETAPAIGARLSSDTGISGECLRTGKVQNCVDTENDPLVDVEVCRRLGLRSIAVLPIPGWRGINGILEVFSTKPAHSPNKILSCCSSWPRWRNGHARRVPMAPRRRHPSSRLRLRSRNRNHPCCPPRTASAIWPWHISELDRGPSCSASACSQYH